MTSLFPEAETPKQSWSSVYVLQHTATEFFYMPVKATSWATPTGHSHLVSSSPMSPSVLLTRQSHPQRYSWDPLHEQQPRTKSVYSPCFSSLLLVTSPASGDPPDHQHEQRKEGKKYGGDKAGPALRGMPGKVSKACLIQQPPVAELSLPCCWCDDQRPFKLHICSYNTHGAAAWDVRDVFSTRIAQRVCSFQKGPFILGMFKTIKTEYPRTKESPYCRFLLTIVAFTCEVTS